MLYVSDLNMIKAIDFLKESGEIKFKKDCYALLGIDGAKVHKMQFPERYTNKQSHHFTAEQIRILCTTYGLDINFIFGLTSEIHLNKRKIKVLNGN